MDSESVAETGTDREIRAYVAGFEEMAVELRGYGLSEAERTEVELEAVALYGAAPVEPVEAPRERVAA